MDKVTQERYVVMISLRLKQAVQKTSVALFEAPLIMLLMNSQLRLKKF